MAIVLRRMAHVGEFPNADVKGTTPKTSTEIAMSVDYEGEFSLRFHVVLDETKQTRDALELNDSEKGQTYYWNRLNHKVNGFSETKVFGQIQPFSQDSLSALYYIRTFPLGVGEVVTFPVISEGNSWDAVGTVLRKETQDTPLGRIQTLLIRPEMKYQGILKRAETVSFG